MIAQPAMQQRASPAHQLTPTRPPATHLQTISAIPPFYHALHGIF